MGSGWRFRRRACGRRRSHTHTLATTVLPATAEPPRRRLALPSDQDHTSGDQLELTRDHTYEAPVDAVIDMLANADAVTQRYSGMGHRDIEIRECERSADSARIVTSRVVDVDLPGFARKVIAPTNTMVQTDEWHRDGEVWNGTFDVQVDGAPVEMSGTLSVTPDGDRCRYDVTTTMKVKVPLVGGKIADWAGKNDIPKTLQAEFDANDAWLSEHQ